MSQVLEPIYWAAFVKSVTAITPATDVSFINTINSFQGQYIPTACGRMIRRIV